MPFLAIGMVLWLVAEKGNAPNSVWEANGEWIVFSCGRFSNHSSSSSIYVMRPDGSSLQRITDSRLVATSPSWSPNGEWIAFINEESEIHVIRPENSDSEIVVGVDKNTNYSMKIEDIDWSPNSDWIAYMISDRETNSIRLASVANQSQRLLVSSENALRYPRWSPDGVYLAYADISVTPKSGIYTISVNGGESRFVFPNRGIIGFLTWTQDGTGLLFDLMRDQSPQLYSLNLQTEDLLPINIDHYWASPEISPSGEWLVFSGLEATKNKFEIYKSRIDGSQNQLLTQMVDCDALSPRWFSFFEGNE